MMNKFIKFIIGAAFGAALGSILVLLFTPFKGKEIQSRILTFVDNIKVEFDTAAGEKRIELQEKLNRLRQG
jgi:gas vesicle protein